MVERRGSVKLFGATIQVVAEGDALHVGEEQQKEHLVEESMTGTKERDQESPECRSGSDPLPSSVERESKELAPADEGSETVKTEEKRGGKGDVPLKKPDKILPCPRCMSMDTKFCYYNNYNVNQPRHFCKKCQRYWTDGGTMRDMPVGAGRRKSKNFASYYRHVHVLDITTQRDRHGIPELVHPSALKPDEVILSFGNDHKKDDAEVSSRSSETGLTCAEERGWTALQEAELQNCQAYTRQVPCVSVPLLPCPWNPSPALFASSIPVSLVSANSSWSSAISGASNFPWLPNMSCPPPSNMQSESGHVPPLRKHPRDENTHSSKNPEDCYDMEESSQKRSLWIPKALRIDDPDEAVKSSLWTTMGIKNSLADGISSRGPFEALQPKTETMNQRAATSHVLHANPVALLRSLRFQESI